MTKHDGEKTRQRIIGFILQFTEAQGCPPQQYQIAHGIGLTYSGVNYQLQVLQNLGYVVKQLTLKPTWVVIREDQQQCYARPRKIRRKSVSGEQLFRHAQRVFDLPTFGTPSIASRLDVSLTTGMSSDQ